MLTRLSYVKAPAPEREPWLAEMLARIKQEAAESCGSFRTPMELGRLVRDDLAALPSERFIAGRPTVAEAKEGGEAGVGPAGAAATSDGSHLAGPAGGGHR